jgi:hypothetical protein
MYEYVTCIGVMIDLHKPVVVKLECFFPIKFYLRVGVFDEVQFEHQSFIYSTLYFVHLASMKVFTAANW